MADITAELAALPKMPQNMASVHSWRYECEFLRARLAISERLLTEAWTPHRLIADMEKSRDDARAYLAHRAKEQP